MVSSVAVLTENRRTPYEMQIKFSSLNCFFPALSSVAALREELEELRIKHAELEELRIKHDETIEKLR